MCQMCPFLSLFLSFVLSVAALDRHYCHNDVMYRGNKKNVCLPTAVSNLKNELSFSDSCVNCALSRHPDLGSI